MDLLDEQFCQEEEDRQYLIRQIDEAGFVDYAITTRGVLWISAGNGEICVYMDESEPQWCYCKEIWPVHPSKELHGLMKVTDEFINEQGWTPEQIRVLDWTFTLNQTLDAYWNGNTPFKTIEELVAHLKENSPRLFSTSMTKRAVPL